MAMWHARFAAAPRDTTPAHRAWSVTHDALDEVLARREEQVLSKALTFRAGGNLYCVKTSGSGIALRGARVSLYHFLDGTLKVRYKDRILTCTAFRKSPTQYRPNTKRPSMPTSTPSWQASPSQIPAPNHQSRKIVDKGGLGYSAMAWRAPPAVTHSHPIIQKGTFSLCTNRGHSHFALTELTRWQQLGYLTSTLADGAAYRRSYR